MSYNFNAAEVFDVAIQIEENGKKFYEESIKIIDDAGVKKLFVELAGQEVEHKKKFESMKAKLPSEASTPTVWDPDNEIHQYIKMMAEEHIFSGTADLAEELRRVHDVRSALKLAISFEKDSVLFFLSLQDATEGKAGQDTIKALVKEEQEHLRRLSMELKRIGRR